MSTTNRSRTRRNQRRAIEREAKNRAETHRSQTAARNLIPDDPWSLDEWKKRHAAKK